MRETVNRATMHQEKANLGLVIATETSESLKEIIDGINRSANIVAQIAQSSDEQASAICLRGNGNRINCVL